MYDKVYQILVSETGDYTAAAILSFLYQTVYKGTWDNIGQTELMTHFAIGKKPLTRLLNLLQDNGYITYKADWKRNLHTTYYTIKPKTIQLINQAEQELKNKSKNSGNK